MDLAAKKAYPAECCGILLGKSPENSETGAIEVLETREAPNQIQEGQNSVHFQMDPLFLYQVERELDGDNGGTKLDVVGFYHSHPNCKAIPSEEDLKNMIPGLAYVILSITKEGVADVQCYTNDTFL